MIDHLQLQNWEPLAPKEVYNRLVSGQLKILCGEANWPKGWYNDPYARVLIPLVTEIANLFPEITLFQVWYSQEDFFHVRFSLEGEEYTLQWYKICTVYRASDCRKKYIGQLTWVLWWLQQGKYRTCIWEECKSGNPYYEEVPELQALRPGESVC